MTFRFLAVCHTTWNKKFSRPLQMSSFCFLFLFVSFPSIQVQAHHSLCKCLFLFISIFVYLNLVHKGSPRPTHPQKIFWGRRPKHFFVLETPRNALKHSIHKGGGHISPNIAETFSGYDENFSFLKLLVNHSCFVATNSFLTKGEKFQI